MLCQWWVSTKALVSFTGERPHTLTECLCHLPVTSHLQASQVTLRSRVPPHLLGTHTCAIGNCRRLSHPGHGRLTNGRWELVDNDSPFTAFEQRPEMPRGLQFPRLPRLSPLSLQSFHHRCYPPNAAALTLCLQIYFLGKPSEVIN